MVLYYINWKSYHIFTFFNIQYLDSSHCTGELESAEHNSIEKQHIKTEDVTLK